MTAKSSLIWLCAFKFSKQTDTFWLVLNRLKCHIHRSTKMIRNSPRKVWIHHRSFAHVWQQLEILKNNRLLLQNKNHHFKCCSKTSKLTNKTNKLKPICLAQSCYQASTVIVLFIFCMIFHPEKKYSSVEQTKNESLKKNLWKKNRISWRIN